MGTRELKSCSTVKKDSPLGLSRDYLLSNLSMHFEYETFGFNILHYEYKFQITVWKFLHLIFPEDFPSH
jgi:hypothetical protein